MGWNRKKGRVVKDLKKGQDKLGQGEVALKIKGAGTLTQTMCCKKYIELQKYEVINCQYLTASGIIQMLNDKYVVTKVIKYFMALMQIKYLNGASVDYQSDCFGDDINIFKSLLWLPGRSGQVPPPTIIANL